MCVSVLMACRLVCTHASTHSVASSVCAVYVLATSNPIAVSQFAQTLQNP